MRPFAALVEGGTGKAVMTNLSSLISQSFPGDLLIHRFKLFYVQAIMNRPNGFRILGQAGSLDLSRRPGAITYQMQIQFLKPMFLDSEELISVISRAGPFELRAVATLPCETITISCVYTTA